MTQIKHLKIYLFCSNTRLTTSQDMEIYVNAKIIFPRNLKIIIIVYLILCSIFFFWNFLGYYTYQLFCYIIYIFFHIFYLYFFEFFSQTILPILLLSFHSHEFIFNLQQVFLKCLIANLFFAFILFHTWNIFSNLSDDIVAMYNHTYFLYQFCVFGVSCPLFTFVFYSMVFPTGLVQFYFTHR